MNRDLEEDRLRDVAHDAFMAFWRSADTAAADELWMRYYTAEACYEVYLLMQPTPTLHPRPPDLLCQILPLDLIHAH